ncbi:hypothetical protein KKF34_04160 [Myxococcota bacterium]|nr:hypothetical protein [Myxococcota bacterium]MBU1380196.1 hypothetical protein [Myxococcota bacterium]MBU1496051.1 hypothetical protein [Myxococcota bacterium]
MFRKFLFIISTLLISTACDVVDEVQISIVSPEKGSFISGAEPVTVTIKSDKKDIDVNGEILKGGKNVEVTLPAVDGLGTVKASIPGDPLFAFRSWLQGTFLDPALHVPDSISITLSQDLIGETTSPFGEITSWLLTDEDLSPWVDNPLTMQITVLISTVNVNVNIDSAVAENAEFQFEFLNNELHVNVTMTNVDGTYTASAVSLNSTGTFHYDNINISGKVVFDENLRASLVDSEVVTSEPVINDSGALNDNISALSDLFDEEVPAAIQSAAENATADVFDLLISNMAPSIRLEFDENPVTQESLPTSLTFENNMIKVTYSTKFSSAISPAEGTGILERPADLVDFNGEIGTASGSRIFNQIAYAAWNGGNLERTYSRGYLEDLGMEDLDFPYDNLNSVNIKMLLPPILEWRTDGPWIDAGGIELYLDVSATDNATAWTAAKIPVKLIQVEDGFQLTVDEAREPVIEDAGFNKMSKLVDHDKVRRIMRSAIPGVISDLFGSMPIASVNPLTVPRFTGSGYCEITPTPTSMNSGTNNWNIYFTMSLAFH